MENNKKSSDVLANEQDTTESPHELEKAHQEIDADDCINSNYNARIVTKFVFFIAFTIHFLIIKVATEESNLTEPISNDLFLELQQMQRFTDLISGGILALLISCGFQQLIGYDTEKSHGIPSCGIAFMRFLGVGVYIMVCLCTTPLNTVFKLVMFMIASFFALILC